MSKKVKKLIPELRFSEFEGDWEYGKLQNLINKLDAGVSVNSESHKAFKNDKGVLKTSCVSTGKFDPNENKLVSDEYEKTRLKEPVTKDTIVICRSNTPIFVGSNAYIEQDRPNLFLPDKLWAAKTKKHHIAKWVSYLLLKGKTRKLLSLRATGTSNSMKNISKGDLLTLPIYFPKKEEQEKIASFLDTIALRITQLRRKHELLETYKKGVMQKIFSQQIRFKQDDGKSFPDWEKKKLKNIAKINPSSSNFPSKFLYIDLERVNNGILSDPELIVKENAPSRAQRVLKKGDILYQTVRPYQRNNLFFNIDGDYVASTGYAQLRSKESRKFLYQLIYNNNFVNKVISRCTGTSYPAINSKDLANISFLLPKSLEEQEKIANFLTLIDRKNKAVALQIEKLEKFKKGLLQKMFV